MKWLLVVIVLNSPVKTDLVFDTLDDCLSAEQAMRAEWAEMYNHAMAKKLGPDSAKLIRSQMTSGTCIPANGT